MKQWQDYRRRRKLLFFAIFGYIPACAVFYLVTMQLYSDRFVQPFAICWMAISAFAFIRVSVFRCPRCGNKFFIRRRLAFFSDYRMFAQKCMHCDLPKYSVGETHAL